MAFFPQMELTNDGVALLARVQAKEGTLNFTKTKLGDGNYAGDIKLLTDLINEFKEQPITGTAVQPDNSTAMKTFFNNDGFLTSYDWREIGVYAKLGETGTEILYSYTNAGVNFEYIPSEGEGQYTRTLDLRSYTSDVANVTFDIIETKDKYDFNTVAEMVAATYLVIGDRIKLWGRNFLGDRGIQDMIIGSDYGIKLYNGLYAKYYYEQGTAIKYGSLTDPSQLDKLTLLSETLLDETIVGKLQGFEYDDDNDRCFIISYLDTVNPFPENESITIAEYNVDDDGALTTLVAREFNLGFGHGEALLIDTSVEGKTYIWISSSSDGTGSPVIRRLEWDNGVVSTLDYPFANTLFSFADTQNGDVLMQVDGKNHYIDFSNFKNGDFTPNYVESRKSIENNNVVSAGNQSFKKRYGIFYGLSGFNMNAADASEAWKSQCYLTAGDNTLRLSYVSGTPEAIEPENIGWRKNSIGEITTVIACKSANSVKLFKCSGNAGEADSVNLGKGIFKKLSDYPAPISRNSMYTESRNPFATMFLGIGAGITSDAEADLYNNFYLTQKGNTGTNHSANIHHHNEGELIFHSKQHNLGEWTYLTTGFEYQILFSADRGKLGKFPLQVTKDNVLIGETTNAEAIGAVTTRASSDQAGMYSYGGLVDFVGQDYSTKEVSLYISKYDFVGNTRTRWYLFQEDRFRPTIDGASKLGEAAIRWEEVFAVNGTINTSDEREKTFEEITSLERECALELKSSIKKFKWKKSLARENESGNKARIHFGVGAQTVKSIFEKHGLIASDYSLFCYDEWNDRIDENGGEVLSGGNRYGIRYSELLCFIISAM